MKVHWVFRGNQKDVAEISWNSACGLWFSDEEAEAGHASPESSDATCRSCRRSIALMVDSKLATGHRPEVVF